MKKIFNLFMAACLPACITAQNISINTDHSAPHPSAILDVKSNTKGLLIPRTSTISRNGITNPAKGLIVYDTTAGSFWFYNGSGWNDLSAGNSSNYWTLNGIDILNSNPGNIGIGTNTPLEKLSVQTLNNSYGISHRGEGGNILATRMGGTSAGVGTFSPTNMRIFANGISRILIAEATGNVGIGTDNPTSKLQIGEVPGFANYDLGIGNGTQAMAFQQNANFSNWQSNTNITLYPNNGTGYVGINSTSPTNKLQIGSLGANGFTGNDLAIGNGTNAMVVAQSNVSTLIASTTDIIFLPHYGGHGRVGINTDMPRAPLDVADNVVIPSTSVNFYSYHNYYSYLDGIGSCNNDNTCTPKVSIYASSAVLATEFDAYSDARIKNLSGTSNSAKDLEVVNALQIRDYTMKDKIKYGDRPFKKVIAQEVEKIYPQVVSSHKDFIPNVYQLTDKIEKAANGYLLHFATKHTISNRAKKLQLIMDGPGGMLQFDIVGIPSANEVVINAVEIKSDKVFVYGEEVNDFRSVDYEGLSTLTISATQELSKLINALSQKVDAQAEEIKLLKGKQNISTAITLSR